jgi:WD40 repeat protein
MAKRPPPPVLPSPSRAGWSAVHESSDCNALRFSPTGETVAIGCFNGNVYIRSSADSQLAYRITAVCRSSPITCLRWHPCIPGAMIVSSSAGYVSCAHIQSGEHLWSFDEPNNVINAIDCSPAGSHLATAGSDCAVRYYDVRSQTKLLELAPSRPPDIDVTGHTSRVFACAFASGSELASGGWDDSVLIWDLRAGAVARAFFGMHICGEALCLVGGAREMLTGSWRATDQIQLWDVGTAQMIKAATIGTGPDVLRVYALNVSADEKVVAAGGSGRNCVMFFDAKTLDCVASTEPAKSPVTSLDVALKRFAYGLTNSDVIVDPFPLW